MEENKYYVKKRIPIPRVQLPAPPDFARILLDLRAEGMSFEGLSREIGCSREALYSLISERVTDPKYLTGIRLLAIWRLTFGKRLYTQSVRGASGKMEERKEL